MKTLPNSTVTYIKHLHIPQTVITTCNTSFSQDSIISIVTTLWAEWPGVQIQADFSPFQSSDWLWSPPSTQYMVSANSP